MEYETILSTYVKGEKDAEPICEDVLLETPDLEQVHALREDILTLVDGEVIDMEEETDDAPGVIAAGDEE